MEWLPGGLTNVSKPLVNCLTPDIQTLKSAHNNYFTRAYFSVV